MERNQRDGLLELRVQMETSPGRGSERRGEAGGGRRTCSRCSVVLAAVMGCMVVALLLAFVNHHFLLKAQSCQNDTHDGLNLPAIHILTSKVKNGDKDGRHHIFKAEKQGTFLIYGWLKANPVPNEEVVLRQRRDNRSRDLERKNSSAPLTFFFSKVMMYAETQISIDFKFKHTDSLFHFYQLLAVDKAV